MKMFSSVQFEREDLSPSANKVEAIQVETVQSVVKLSTSARLRNDRRTGGPSTPVDIKEGRRLEVQVRDATCPNRRHYSPSVDGRTAK